MKRAFQVLPVIAAIAFGGMLVAAQDEDSNPQMSLVIIEQVKPSMKMQYEEATKAMCALLTKHDADPQRVGFWTVSGPEIGYAFVMMLPEGFGSMSTVHENWMGMIESIGMESWKALAAKADACVESRSMIHSVYREDLSYIPEKPSLKEDEIEFVQYDFLYPVANMEEEFAEIAKEWKDLYERKGITTGWRVYERITGDDLPSYLIAKAAKSEVDYHKTRAEIREKLGEAGKTLGERSGRVIRKVESKAGYPRPDLSYPTKTEE